MTGPYIAVLAFFCEYMDSTLGMGYGTTLAPVLLLMGYTPLEVVPAILLSELVTGLFAAVMHHKEGNVDLMPRSGDIFKIQKMLQPLGYVETFRRTVPMHLKVALLLSVLSIVGTVAAVFIAINIPKFWLKLYIGCLVSAMGLVLLFCRRTGMRFSWKKIMALGLLASFNKGISGGGYGPIVTGGQILSGLDGKSAVGITSLAEGLTCLAGVTVYWLTVRERIGYELMPWLIAGAMLSVPFSARTVRKVSRRAMILAVALITLALGLLTIAGTLLAW